MSERPARRQEYGRMVETNAIGSVSICGDVSDDDNEPVVYVYTEAFEVEDDEAYPEAPLLDLIREIVEDNSIGDRMDAVAHGALLKMLDQALALVRSKKPDQALTR